MWRSLTQRGVDTAAEWSNVLADRLSAAADPRAKLLRKRRWALRLAVFFTVSALFWIAMTALVAAWDTPVWALFIPSPIAVGAAFLATLAFLRYRWLRREPLPPQRDLAKKAKKEEKRLRKAQGGAGAGTDAQEGPPEEPQAVPGAGDVEGAGEEAADRGPQPGGVEGEGPDRLAGGGPDQPDPTREARRSGAAGRLGTRRHAVTVAQSEAVRPARTGPPGPDLIRSTSYRATVNGTPTRGLVDGRHRNPTSRGRERTFWTDTSRHRPDVTHH